MILRPLFLLGLAAASLAHRIEVEPGQKECFFEHLNPEDRMTVTYEVGGSSAGGHLDIDFYVVEPRGGVVYTSHKEPQGTFSLAAETAGQYTYCFSNEMSSYARKTLSGRVCVQHTSSRPRSMQLLELSTSATLRKLMSSFNVHGVLFVGEEEHIAPVEQEIRDLSTGLQMVKDEQAYLVVRERVHRNTCESTNSRVKWWAIVQIVILLGVYAWNVHYLKSWFEVKRVL